MTKTYIAQRPPDDEVGDCRVVVEDGAGGARPLRHFPLHSPGGFEWGYGGSGPADLALAILADHLGELPDRRSNTRAYALRQRFKWRFIAGAPRAGFRLTSGEIAAWLQQEAMQT